MATRNTSTKAKTKTSKRIAQTQTDVRNSKAATARAASVTRTGTPNLNRWHILSVGVFGLLAVLAALFMGPTSYQTTVGYLTQDGLTNALAPAGRHFYEFEIRWLVVAVMAASVVLPVLYLTRYKAAYERNLREKVVASRWLECALTGVVIIETIALASGQTDIVSLKLMGVVVFALAFLAWLDERAPTRAVFVGKNLLKFFLALFLAVPLLATLVYGQVRASWFVYALYAGLVFMLVAYGVNRRRQLRGQDYIVTERNYLFLKLLGRGGFAVILILGLMS